MLTNVLSLVTDVRALVDSIAETIEEETDGSCRCQEARMMNELFPEKKSENDGGKNEDGL